MNDFPSRRAAALAALDDALPVLNAIADPIEAGRRGALPLPLPMAIARLNGALEPLGLAGVFKYFDDDPARPCVRACAPDTVEHEARFQMIPMRPARKRAGVTAFRVRGIAAPARLLETVARRWRTALERLESEPAFLAAFAGHPCFGLIRREPKRRGRHAKYSAQLLRRVHAAWRACHADSGTLEEFLEERRDLHKCSTLADLKKLIDAARKHSE